MDATGGPAAEGAKAIRSSAVIDAPSGLPKVRKQSSRRPQALLRRRQSSNGPATVLKQSDQGIRNILLVHDRLWATAR